MKILAAAALIAATLMPAPLLAQSLNDTHERVWAPAGKGPAVTYRPIDARGCSAATTPHLSGKSPAAVPMQSVTCDQIAQNAREAKRLASAR